MKKYIKICAGFIIVILTGSVIAFRVLKQNIHTKDKRFETEKYVQFGRYNSKPILWKVVDINEQGILLFSDKIIACKIFDEKEKGKTYGTSKYGSSKWSNSNIREWLNSSTKKVDFTTPYSKEFYNEPGFLYNFTRREISDIQNIINKTEYDINTKDKIFLLSKSEWEHVKSFDHLIKGRVELTQECKRWLANANDMIKERYFLGGYWLRTPGTQAQFNSFTNVQAIAGSGVVCQYVAYDYVFGGVRPAVYLKLNTLISSGKGNSKNPYIIK